MISLVLETQTWAKEVCDLVDYDNGKLAKSSLNITNTSYIYRRAIQIINSSEKINEDKNELLFKIRMSFGKTKQLEIIRNKYKLDENDNLISPNPCFFILKPNVIGQKMNIYKLNPGEIIKIGRITMRIRDIKFKNKEFNNSLNVSITKNKLEKDEVNPINSINNANDNCKEIMIKKMELKEI